MYHNPPALFTDPHLSYPIHDIDLPFSDYIRLNKQLIRENRQDLDPQRADHIIECNAPFEYRPSAPPKKGVLLIQGLLDSAFIMRDIAAHLEAHGFLIRSVLLPGHGTVPGALLNVTLEEWIATVQYGVHSLKKEVDEIFLVGFSTGAALSVYHALTSPDGIAGLALLAPAFKIHSAVDFMSGWHTPISRHWNAAAWLCRLDEIDYTKYRSIPLNAVYQVYRLTQLLKKMNQTQRLTQPTLTILNYDDTIVSTKTCMDFFKNNPNEKNRMLIYTRKPLALDHPHLLQRPSAYPKWNIKDLAHVAVPVSPLNPHYGMEGDYLLASHVKEHSPIFYGEMDRSSVLFYSLLYRAKWIKNKHRILTFNPDFDFMVKEIGKFLGSN